MSNIKRVVEEIQELVEQGMSAKFICITLGVPYEMALQAIEEREALEIEKQYEMLSYAEECANDDAQYYGEE